MSDPKSTPPPSSATPPRLDSETLFAGASVVLIQHQGCEYRLQITRQGKLILTK